MSRLYDVRLTRTACLAATIVAACNGAGGGLPVASDGGDSPTGRESTDAGMPFPLCGALVVTTPCEPGTACVLSAPGAGHCMPDGEGGGKCLPKGAAARCGSGFACSGKDGTCIPVSPPGSPCAATACDADSSCGRIDEVPLCVVPGARAGRCRATSPGCDMGLGCVSGAGVCGPLGSGGVCFDGNDTHFGCPDGKVCPHVPGDRSTARAHCAVPGVLAGPCGDPALGKSTCAPGLACAGGVCRADAIPPDGVCLPGAAHAPCVDGAICEGNICWVLGIEGRPCRPAGTFAAPCDLGLFCEEGTCRFHLPPGAACEASPIAAVTCERDTSCLSVAESSGAPAQCTPDGALGSRCRRPFGDCDPGLVCAAARDGGTVCRDGLPAGTRCTRAREPFEPCAPGTHCGLIDGTCVPDGIEGARCASAGIGDGALGGACGPGLWCAFDGVAAYCFRTPPTVPVGAACDQNATVFLRLNRCEEGLFCVSGTCRPAGTMDAPCRPIGPNALAGGGRCDAGLACANGQCVIGKADGGGCVPGGDGDCGVPSICVGAPGHGICRNVSGFAMTESPAAAPPFDACAAGTVLSFQGVGDPAIAARDDGFARVGLPFPLSFWGDVRHEMFIHTDGVAGFPPSGEIFNPGHGGQGLLPIGSAPALIAPFWDDLFLGAARVSEICHETVGAMGARRFIVTWRHLGRFGRTGVNLTFSLVLHEADGAIEFSYADLFGAGQDAAFAGGVRAAIGIQAAGGVRAVVHSGAVSVHRRVRFVPQGP